MTHETLAILRQLVADPTTVRVHGEKLYTAPIGAERCVPVEPRDAIRALDLFLAGELTADELRLWAEHLEMREEIALLPAAFAPLRELLFQAANPEINDPFDRGRAESWLKELKSTEGAAGS